MINSIRRKTLATALAIALPPALAVYSYAGSNGLWVTLLATLPGILAALVLGTGLSRRLQRCTAFVNSMPDPASPRNHLSFGGADELGMLTHALNSAGPKVREIVQGLTMELTRYEAIVSGLTEGVLVVDSKLTITFCNRAFVEAIGDHGVAKGLPLIKVIREPALLEALKAVVDSGTEVRKRLELSVQDGRIFEIHAAPVAGAPSRSAAAILHDLTPRERLDRIRRDFIANVSHEFRTPLATIRGFAETLLDGGLEDQQNRRKFVEVIYANSVRLNNIASDLLSLSEIEGGPVEAEAGPVSVGEVVQSSVLAMEPVAKMNDVCLLTEKIQDCHIRGSRIRLEQAVLNLVDNAIKFNKPQGEVHVRLSIPSEQLIEISVWDTGLGIPRESLTRIFERFYRVDKARSRQVGGTGLGLSIVKHAVESMNGQIKVESELGTGSRFTILLPRLLTNSAVG